MDESSRTGRENRQAHIESLIRVDIGVGQRCRACDEESTALPAEKTSTRNVPLGRWNVTHAFDSQASSPTATTQIAKVSIPAGKWKKVQGKLKMHAHRSSSIVIDIAAFEVSHCVYLDTTTLRAKKRSA